MTTGDALLGRVLGERYRLIGKLGEGGFASVYEAEHVSLERRFAVKVLRVDLGRDDTFARRFEREARLTSALDHPHIVPVTDFGRDPQVGLLERGRPPFPHPSRRSAPSARRFPRGEANRRSFRLYARARPGAPRREVSERLPGQ